MKPHYENNFSTAARCAEFNGLRVPAGAGTSPAATLTPLQCVTEGGETFARISATPAVLHWFDPNHMPPGLGGLFVLAGAYSKEWAGTGPIPARRDLRGCELEVRMRVTKLQKPLDSQLLFWFQTINPDGEAPLTAAGVPEYVSMVNYVCTDQNLFERLGFGKTPSRVDYVERCRWVDFVIPFDGIEEHWDCLGSNKNRTRDVAGPGDGLYQCASSVDSALSNWKGNMGFVLLHPGATSRPATETFGNIDLAYFAIWKPRRERD
jgi:hypothetical protein